MFPRKAKPVSTPPIPRHSFRMRAVGTEFEAHGWGLIVALIAVVLVMAVLGLGAFTATSGVGWVAGKVSQNAPATPVRPPQP